MSGRALILPLRPGKAYVHAADLFDALTEGHPGWRRARLRVKEKLLCGGLLVPVAELPAGLTVVAQMEIERGCGPSCTIAVLALPQYPAPPSTRPIPEAELLAGSCLQDDACFAFGWNAAHPFALTAVTAALELLWLQECESEWLLGEIDLPNPQGWRDASNFCVRRRPGGQGRRLCSLVVEQEQRPVGFLHFARCSPDPNA